MRLLFPRRWSRLGVSRMEDIDRAVWVEVDRVD
jgi:hypothetical protein